MNAASSPRIHFPKPPRGLAARLAWAGPYAPILGLLLLGTVGLAVSRAGLVLWQWPRVEPTGGAATIMLQGLRSDLIMLGWVIAPALLLLPVFLGLRRIPSWLRLSCTWFALALSFVALMELMTPSFLIQYDVRPNRTFVDYLEYPREVLLMLWAGFRYQLVAALLAIAALGWLIFRQFGAYRRAARPWSIARTLWVWPLAVFCAFMMIRSNTHGRPVHLGNFSFCGDATVNSLVANSAYSMLYAAYQIRREAGLSQQYGEMPIEEVIRRTRAQMGVAADRFVSDSEPTLRVQTASVRRERPLNLVIIMQESLGASFVGSLGGDALTPNIDRLADQSLWFEQMYATGTRTSRGIEALIAGFPPTPALPIVRLSKSQKDFFTIGTALRQAGYRNEFVYGGDANFDNRGGFLLSNGFDAVIDRDDYVAPVFPGYLGVSDEDLFNKLHERLGQLQADSQPHFLLALSISHHAPYDYPPGRIEVGDGNPATVENTARYADYAVGQFIDRARKSDYWNNTVFLVVADHESELRIRGDALVPVDGFHIPALIVGADIQPRRVKSTASQIDLAPTLLSLLGVDATVAFAGRDLTRTLPEFGNVPAPVAPRALMQYNQNFAWVQNGRVTVLSPDENSDKVGEVHQYLYDPASETLTPAPDHDPEAEKEALAQALLPAWLYEQQRYRAPAQRSLSAP
ncbi:MAG TPA: LTA synthase family protein [Fontimonas sp.]